MMSLSLLTLVGLFCSTTMATARPSFPAMGSHLGSLLPSKLMSHCLKDHPKLKMCEGNMTQELDKLHATLLFGFGLNKDLYTKACSAWNKFETCLGHYFDKCMTISELVKDFDLEDYDQKIQFVTAYTTLKQYNYLCGPAYKDAISNYDCITKHIDYKEGHRCMEDFIVHSKCDKGDFQCKCKEDEKMLEKCIWAPMTKSCGTDAGHVFCQFYAVGDTYHSYAIFFVNKGKSYCQVQC